MQDQNGMLNCDFQTCLQQLVEYGTVSAPRGSETKELLNYNITLKDPRNRIVLFKARKTNLAYLLGEFIWYLGGENTIEGILPYSKFWAQLENSGDVDGYQKGTINSNYGNRLFGKSDLNAFYDGNPYMGPANRINQWEETVALLTRDKDTRQAVMNIHVPSDRHAGNKDVTCTLSLQWFIRENHLHLIVNMRSNDVIRGFTNDVFQFTMLQECMLVQLKEVYPELELGHYFHNAGSMHLYELHYDMADQIIQSPAIDLPMVPMDVFDAVTVQRLITVQSHWLSDGKPENYDFVTLDAFQGLSPYWQTLVEAMFNKDEDALHDLFGQNHDH